MKLRISILLALFAVLLGLTACGEKAASAATTTDPTDITLVPCTSEESGISGVVPRRWVEVKPGQFQRVLGTDPTLLGQVTFPGATIEQVTGQWQLPGSIGSMATADLTWDLYSAELEWPNAGTLLWDIG